MSKNGHSLQELKTYVNDINNITKEEQQDLLAYYHDVLII
jgi:hypothetical protein